MAKKDEFAGRFSSWASHAVAQSPLGVALLLLPPLIACVAWTSLSAETPITERWIAFAGRSDTGRKWGPTISNDATSIRNNDLETGDLRGELTENDGSDGTTSLISNFRKIETALVDGPASLTETDGVAVAVAVDGRVDGDGRKEKPDGAGDVGEEAKGTTQMGGKDTSVGEGGVKGRADGVEEGKGVASEVSGKEEGGGVGAGAKVTVGLEGSESAREGGGERGRDEEKGRGGQEEVKEETGSGGGGKEGSLTGRLAGGLEGGSEGGGGQGGQGGEGGEGGKGDDSGEDDLVGCEEMMNEPLSDSSGTQDGAGEGGADGNGESREGGEEGEDKKGQGGKEGGEEDVPDEKQGDAKQEGGEGDVREEEGKEGKPKRGKGRDRTAGAVVISPDSSVGTTDQDGNSANNDAVEKDLDGTGSGEGGASKSPAAAKRGGKKHKIKLDVPVGCDLYHGSWIPDPRPLLYTNDTCQGITRHQNCQGNGRPDSAYQQWQWQPDGQGCKPGLPRFDAEDFMRVMRRKGVLFVGDSVARNHFESLVCLLSQVEQPEQHGSKAMLRLYFPSSKVTLARVNSAWLVDEGNDTVPDCPDSIPRLHLDRTSSKWFGEVGRFDVVMFSSAHWFVKPSIYMEGEEVIGSQGGWWKKEGPPKVDNKGAFALAIRTVFQDVVKELRKNPNRVFIYRTFSPDHYERGEWNTGGSCAGLTEPRGANYTYNNSFGLNLYTQQLQAYDEAMEGAKEAGESVDRLRFTLMDVMPSAGMRVDGHPGPYRGVNAVEELAKYNNSRFPPPQDCLHWCLPGPIDSWNVFLLQIIKRGFASIQGG